MNTTTTIDSEATINETPLKNEEIVKHAFSAKNTDAKAPNQILLEPDSDPHDPLARIDYTPKNILDNFRKSCRLKIMKELRKVFPRVKPYFTRTGKTITIDIPQSTVNLANQITSLGNMEVSHKVYPFSPSTKPFISPK